MSEDRVKQPSEYSLEQLSDPRIKIYDPFAEYRGCDDQKLPELPKPTDPISRFVARYGYFARTTLKERYDTEKEKYVECPEVQQPCLEEEKPVHDKPPAVRPGKLHPYQGLTHTVVP